MTPPPGAAPPTPPPDPGEPPVASLEQAVQFLGAGFLAVLRNALLYHPQHAQFQRALGKAERTAEIAFGYAPEIVFVCLEGELFFAGRPMNKRGTQFQRLADFMASLGVQQLRLLPGLTAEELGQFALQLIGRTASGEETGRKCLRPTSHIRVGRLLDQELEGGRLTRQAIAGLVTSGAISEEEVAALAARREPGTAAEAGGEAVARAERAILGAVSASASREMTAREALLGLLTQLVRHGGCLALLGRLREHHAPTYLHAVNVALLSAALARAQQAPAPLLREVVLAGLLHDIGKLAVPAPLLDRAGSRSPEEERIYQGHCAAGAALLLRHDPTPRLAVAAAFQHHIHSRGGGGFPRDRRCAQPHPVSQVVALANFYDGARIERPGQPPRTLEGILAEIRKETLGQFHPALAAALPRALGEFEPWTASP